MSDLFSDAAAARLSDVAPLAMRLRPSTLDEFVGQEQVLGEGSALRLAIAADRVGSMILYGPPGSGKTTLARIVAHTTGAQFEELSAVSATVKAHPSPRVAWRPGVHGVTMRVVAHRGRRVRTKGAVSRSPYGVPPYVMR